VTGRKHYNPRRGPGGAERRTVGWEFVHVCVDDATRLAYVEVLDDNVPAARSASSAGPSASTAATGSRSSA